MVSADKPTEKVEEKPKVKKPVKTKEEPKAESADKPIEKVVQEPVKKEKQKIRTFASYSMREK